ncbi:hypothetical protein KKH13_05045 [Patescibacteria group bacterium]|nr:hypothetical protein [Patescibacteria group bacterium]
MELRWLEKSNGERVLQTAEPVEGVRNVFHWTDVYSVKEPCIKDESKKSEKVWCEHIDWRKIDWDSSAEYWNWYIHGGGWGLQPTSESMFCPICGKPRPEEVKSEPEKALADVIEKSYYESIKSGNCRSWPETEAQAAIEEVVKVIEEYKKDRVRESIECVVCNDLITKIRGMV